MAGTLLVGAEGVILIPDQEAYGASRPIHEGLELVLQLKNFPTGRLVVLVGEEDTKLAEHWVKVQGLKGAGVVGIAAEDRHEDPDLAQWYAIERQRSAGPINMVLTAYQSVYDCCKVTHQPVLLFGRRGAIGSLDNRFTWDDLHNRVIRTRDAAVEEDEHEYSD